MANEHYSEKVEVCFPRESFFGVSFKEKWLQKSLAT